MSIIDTIVEARKQYHAHGWLDSECPSVKNLVHALENGSLSAFDAKLAQVVVSEAVRPTDGFSGAVEALSPIFWARGNIDLPEKATLGDWEAGKWLTDCRREIAAGTSDLDDWQIGLLESMGLFGARYFDGIAVGAGGHRVALAQDYVIAGASAQDRTRLAATIAFQLVVRGARGPVAYVGTGDTYGLNDAFDVFDSVPDVWPESGVIVCDGLDAEQAKACRSRAFGTGAVLIQTSQTIFRTARKPSDIIALPLTERESRRVFDDDTRKVLEGGGVSPCPAMEIRPDGQRVFFTVADLS